MKVFYRIYRSMVPVLIAVSACVCWPLTASAQTQEQPQEQEQVLTQEDMNLLLSVFDGQQPADIIGKVDAFIATGKTDKEVADAAYFVYNYYRNSRIMGYDEIAIYVADTYFLNGRCELQDRDALMEMKLFSEMNRRSLIGMPAVRVTLPDQAGDEHTIPELQQQDYTVIYFYDDECTNCMRTTPALLQYLTRETKGLNILFYMIYTQEDMTRWMDYVKKATAPFPMPENVKVVHLWDPDLSSDFVTAYGVISTPKLFLLDRDGIIIGRDLTPRALSQVIEVNRNETTALEGLYERVFRPVAYAADTTEVVQVIDAFFEDCKDNPPLFHELFYTMYQYLKSNSSYTLQRGAAYLANKYIVSMPGLWETVTFTDKGVTNGSVIRADFDSVDDFLSEAALGVVMFYRNPLEMPVADLMLRTPKNKKMSIYDVQAEYTVLYFYTLDCELCNAVSPALAQISTKYADSVKVVAIYTGTSKQWKKEVKNRDYGWTDLWDSKRTSGMFDKYDLMDVPAIYLLDKDKKTLAKDINPDVLEVLLEYYLSDEYKGVEE